MGDPPKSKLLYTRRDLADQGVASVSSLEQMAREGRGPRFHRLGKRKIVYRHQDVAAWLREQGVSIDE